MKGAKRNYILRFFYLLTMLVLGILINAGFWETDQFTDIKQFTFYGMSLVFSYILLHMAKRFLWERMRWWDYLYYIALVSIIAPVMFAKSSNEAFFHWVVDVGTMFFIFPILMDFGVMYIQLKKKKQA